MTVQVHVDAAVLALKIANDERRDPELCEYHLRRAEVRARLAQAEATAMLANRMRS